MGTGADPGTDGRLPAVVAGSLTRDRILVDGRAPETRTGGAVWYAGRTLRALGWHVRAVYRRAGRDADLDEALAEVGLAPSPLPARETTAFTLRYRGAPPALVELACTARAEPLEGVAVVGAAAGCALLHLGPLHPEDLEPGLWSRLPAAGPWIALDLQGLCRRVDTDGRIVPAVHPDAPAALAAAGVVKANAGEAALLTGAADPESAARALAEGARGGEALVTLGAGGALAATRDTVWHVPAEPLPPVETTGAGDTCFAAYLARRLEGATPQQALWFAVRYTGRRLAARAA